MNCLGYKVKKASIVYINKGYVRQGDLELDKLFNIKDVTEIVFNKQEEINEKLLKIHDNIQDLMIPFEKRMYYCKEMQGSYSIKYVLHALFPNDPELDYHNLPVVHNGGEAMSIFAELEKYSKEEQEKIRNGLLKYCELDTYAMVKIWEKLKEI